MKRKPIKQAAPRRSATARTMLKTLREFRGDFSTVTMAPDGTISVTYAPPEPVAPSKAAKGDTPRPRLTAIESLSKAPPVFDFETEN